MSERVTAELIQHISTTQLMNPAAHEAVMAYVEQAEAARRRLAALDARDEKVVAALLDQDLDAETVRRLRGKIAAERAELGTVAPPALPDFEHALRVGQRLAEAPRSTWAALSPAVRPAFLRVAFPARLDYHVKTGFRTPDKSLYLSNLTRRNQPGKGEWYPQRGDLSVAEGFPYLTGWLAAGPLVEDRCQHPTQ